MLEGKKIIVTGASRGIGRAIALACAREGAAVGINYRISEEQAQAVQDEIARRFQRPALLLPFDVRDSRAVGEGITRFMGKEGRIDGLVNNAAINLPGLLVTLDLQKIQEQIETNLLGPILCARAVLPVMMAQRGGVILQVGSVTAARASPGQAVYAATKGALESLARALAVEYGRKGIRSHCIRPGPVETDMFRNTQTLAGDEILKRIPLHRFGQAEEIADLAVFLLSDRSGFITGAVHTIDGGYLQG